MALILCLSNGSGTLSLLSIAVTATMTESNLERKKKISSYSLYNLTLREAKTRTQARNLETVTEAEAIEAFSTCFLTQH